MQTARDPGRSRRLGYTSVAEGTVEAFTPTLEHEGHVYRKLVGCQGSPVPVYLGTISLALTYSLDFHARLVHKLSMSRAGEQAQLGSMSQRGLERRCGNGSTRGGTAGCGSGALWCVGAERAVDS